TSRRDSDRAAGRAGTRGRERATRGAARELVTRDRAERRSGQSRSRWIELARSRRSACAGADSQPIRGSEGDASRGPYASGEDPEDVLAQVSDDRRGEVALDPDVVAGKEEDLLL